MILENLIEHSVKKADARIAFDVRVGLSYTAVALDDGSSGVAMTFHHDMPSGCLSLDRPFTGRPVAELIELANSENLLERTVGIASVNAVLNRHQDQIIKGDTLDLLNPGSDDIVGMVGYFGPLISRLQGKVKRLMVFEKNPKNSDVVFPEHQMEEKLPECSLVIITSTSLINRSFESILKAAKDCPKIVMVGGSTPLAPEVFGSWGIDLLSGIIVTDPREILRIVSESGGMKVFGPAIDKVNLYCRN